MSDFTPTVRIMHRAAEKAARRLIRDFNDVEQLQVTPKGPKDFVTIADLNSEKILMQELSKSFPDYGFLSEEAGEVKGADDTHRWIIDPLDGTVNFMHGIPHFCISIALEVTTKTGPEIQCGLIYQPITQECFWAEKKKGAFHNDRRMRVSSRKHLDEALLAMGTIGIRDNDQGYRQLTEAIAMQVGGLRSMGSAALDLAFIAAGKLDGFWSKRLNKWDMAAGILMVQEAGGLSRDMFYKGNCYETGQILASNSALSGKLDKLFATSIRDFSVQSS